MPPSDPAVDPARIDFLYTDLKTMQVELDADPLELGPKRINEKIAQCRGMLSRCETIFLSVSQDLHHYRRQLRTASADYKLRVREMLTNDPEVRMAHSITDREAIAGTKLRAEAEEIDRLTACVEELDSVITVVRIKRADLKDIQGRLRDQLKVCQEELSLGNRWGTRSNPPRRIEDPVGDGVTRLLDEILVKSGSMTGPEALSVDDSAEDAPGIPIEIIGDSSASTDAILEDIPDDPQVPEVMHPDSNVFTDEGIDDLLSRL